MAKFTESEVEDAALEWLAGLGYAVLHGPDIGREGPAPERGSYDEVLLTERLRKALTCLNPHLPAETLEDVLRKVRQTETPSLIEENRRLHRYLVEGVPIEVAREDGSVGGDAAWLIDFDDIEANNWLAVNQFTVIEHEHNRRPDVVLFVNGLPLPEEAPHKLPVEASRTFKVRTPDDLPDLATVFPGGRNNALFGHVRFWAYAQDEGADFDAWADRVSRIASQLNESFPVPLAAKEVSKIARSVSSWTWAGGRSMDHTPEAQRRRGLKSGRVRRAAARRRDRAIVEAVEAGQSMRSIAEEYGLSPSTVMRIVRRGVLREPVTGRDAPFGT